MKYVFFALICVLISCTNARNIEPSPPIQQPIVQPVPDNPATIIYQVPQEVDKRLMTDETLRLLIAELFGTIIALFSIEQTTQNQ